MVDPPPADPSSPQPVAPGPLPDREPIAASFPALLTSFVGRRREVEQVADLLRREDVRLVTLTGPGGVGKTRLALRVTEAQEAAFADGLAFVDLTPVANPDLVAATVAQALGVREAGDRPLPERLAHALRDRRLLLVLDNFERVVDAASLVHGLLAACPHVKALVTSREPLRLSVERVVAVTPMALPNPTTPAGELAEADAVRLFAERAQAVRADFDLTDENAVTIAAICGRLDGLPLAIELAAAHVAHLPPGALLQRLERRLPLLTGGARDVPDRQRTMRNAIAWSHDLLSEVEQEFFRRLAVFVGGSTLEAAEAVAGQLDDQELDILDSLASLVAKSLLRQESDPDGEPRYRMLETVREFALERLAAGGEEAAVRDRHAAWCMDFAERFWTVSRSEAEDPRWLLRAELEHDNLRAALAWLERTDDGVGMVQLAGAIAHLWEVHSHRAEGIGWLERALARGAQSPPAIRLRALIRLGRLLERQGHAERARARHEEELAIARELGDPAEIADALFLLGLVSANQGRYEEATPLVEQALNLSRELGDALTENHCRGVLGVIAYGQDDIAAAAAHVDAALDGWRVFGKSLAMTAVTLDAAALLRCERGDEAGAAALLAESLPLWRQVGEQEGLAEWLAAVARLAACRGQRETAARLYGTAEALSDMLGSPLLIPPRPRYRRHVEALREALGTDDFVAAWAAGRVLPLEQAVEEAWAVATSSGVAAAPDQAVDAMLVVPLTTREREVLRLVAEGLSDREIAERLSISYRTVTSYVRDILTKLDLPSRTAAATFAVRHNLA